MKNTFMVISFVLLCCFAVGCLQRGEVAEKPLADVEADIQAIKDVFTEWSAAYNAANVDKILSYYADEVVRIPPNSPPALGKDAIRPAYEETFNKYILQGKDTVENVEVSGDLAVAHTTYKYVVTPKGGKDSNETKGNEIVVLRKQADCNWKFIYMIWSDESLVSPTQAE